MIYNEKDLEDIVESKSKEIVSKENKEKFDLLQKVLDKTYLSEDNYANDIYLRDDVISAIEEVMDGSYKNHTTCYNCRREGNCKYERFCKYFSPFTTAQGDYFQRKE